MEKPNTPVIPKPSATVMVVRPAAGSRNGMEIFMLRRHARSKFLPDRYVFPGGGLEPHDYEPATLARVHGIPVLNPDESLFRDIPEAGDWDQVVPLSREQEIGLFVAAFRELFEEAGVLLAVDEQTRQPFEVQENEERLQQFAAYRQELHDNRLSFTGMLENNGLLLDATRLVYYSHWITPKPEPHRYDTRFFVAEAVPDQIAESDYRETTDGVWVGPVEALERYRAGTFSLIFPTILHLERLAACSSIAELLEVGRTKDVIAVSPTITRFEDEMNFELSIDVGDRW